MNQKGKSSSMDEDSKSHNSFNSQTEINLTEENSIPGDESEKKRYFDQLKVEILQVQQNLNEQNSQINGPHRSQRTITISLDPSRPNEDFIQITFKIMSDKQRRFHLKLYVPLKLSLTPYLYVSNVQFIVDIQKINAETEFWTLQLQEIIKREQLDDSVLTVTQVRYIVDEIINRLQDPSTTQLNHSHGQSQGQQQINFDKSIIHLSQIPYPVSALCVWAPQGHLLTAFNNVSLTKEKEKQVQLLQTQRDVNNYIYNQNKRKFSENKDQQKNKQSQPLLQEQEEEAENNFMKEGIQIIVNSEQSYDYLNFQFSRSLSYLPNFGELELTTQQSKTKSENLDQSCNLNNYEIFQLTNNQFNLNRFENLKKRVEESSKRIHQFQNTHIFIYDFSFYIYNIVKPIKDLMKMFNVEIKHKKQVQTRSVTQILYKAGLHSFIESFNLNISQFLQSRQNCICIFFYFKVSSQQERFSMELLHLLFRTIYNNLIQKAKNSHLWQLEQLINFLALSWETLINKFYTQDQIYQIFLQIPELPQMSQQLQQIKEWKFKQDYQNKLDQYFISQVLPYFYNNINEYRRRNKQKIIISESQSQLKKMTYITNQKLKRFVFQEQQKYELQTKTQIVKQKELPQINLLLMFPISQRFNNLEQLYQLKQNLRVQNPQLTNSFLKDHQKNQNLFNFVRLINTGILLINNSRGEELGILYSKLTKQEKQLEESMECSICQVEILKSQVAICTDCKHGGHYKHIQDWFSKVQNNQTCPKCFTCKCFQNNQQQK